MTPQGGFEVNLLVLSPQFFLCSLNNPHYYSLGVSTVLALGKQQPVNRDLRELKEDASTNVPTGKSLVLAGNEHNVLETFFHVMHKEHSPWDLDIVSKQHL